MQTTNKRPLPFAQVKAQAQENQDFVQRYFAAHSVLCRPDHRRPKYPEDPVDMIVIFWNNWNLILKKKLFIDRKKQIQAFFFPLNFGQQPVASQQWLLSRRGSEERRGYTTNKQWTTRMIREGPLVIVLLLLFGHVKWVFNGLKLGPRSSKVA